MAWRKDQWNEPSRTDHYLMQVAAEVARSQSSRPELIENKHFIVRFTFSSDTKEPKKLTQEEINAMDTRAKMRWSAFLGKRKTVKHHG